MLDDPHGSSDSHANYGEYLLYALKANIPTDKILSYEQFTGDLSESEDNLDKIKLGFIPPVIGRGASIASDINNAANMINASLDTAKTVFEAASNARSALKRGITMATSGPGAGSHFLDIGNGGDGGNSDPNSWDSGSHFTASNLNLNPKPMKIKLDTGITPNTYGNHYLDADQYHSPLHLTGFRLIFPTSTTGDKLYTYYDNVLSMAFQTLSQAAVAFNISAYQNLSTARLVEYYNVTMYALQVYYFYASILTYTSDPHNRNQGMLELRKGMSADDLDDLFQLKRMLEGIPLPPNLNNMCFYLMQTFTDSELPGSAILKFQPFGFTTTTDIRFTTLQTGQISAAISLMTSSTYRLTESLIARICPNWLSLELLVPSNLPVYDREFNTIWANCPGFSNAYVFPTVTDSSTTIPFNSHDENIDGAVYGLTTLYNATLGKWLPGLVDGNVATSLYSTSNKTNRISYYQNSVLGLSGFYPSSLDVGPDISRGETYSSSSTLPYQRFGTIAALNVNIASVRETSYKVLEWLMSLDTIRKAPSSRQSNPSRNKKRGRRGSSKSKDTMEDKE